MYSYEWDPETGGLTLHSAQQQFSKEPRPVYYKELDILGFDKVWNYEKDDERPYLWAEANNYFYRGRLVAKTKGGTMNAAPELILLEAPEPNGKPLQRVDLDAMVEKNRDLLEKIAAEAIKRIYNTYVEYRDRVDLFYVAFSGGKDSVVALDLVQRALPHNQFKTLFGDTGMEFPDTYDVVDAIEKKCRENNIAFIRSKSVYDPSYTWNQFGPPATVLRWCCSVHKTAPQILALRKDVGKVDFTGMAFIGVRASESLSRNDYDYISLGEKHKGQYSCNPILEWNSAEIYLYIYAQNLRLNEAYKKGNRRVGCLICPRAAERNDYMCRACYPKEYDALAGTIRSLYENNFSSSAKLEDFIAKGGWKARKNGRDLSLELNYSETIEKGRQIILIKRPRADWKEWIKTIGVLLNDKSPYKILFRNERFVFDVKERGDELQVSFAQELLKLNPAFAKHLKIVFRKAACCVQCGECEVECHNGCVSMANGVVTVNEKCRRCLQCHKEKGCLVYKSLELPSGGLRMSANKSLNCYSHHAPKMDWFLQFFKYKDSFAQNHTLGSQMYSFFKRFLHDAELLDKNGYSRFASTIERLSLDNPSSWGLMLVNLAYTPLVNWLVKRVGANETVDREYAFSLLVADGAKESWVSDVWLSFARLLELPFGQVGLGFGTKEKNKLVSITRKPWSRPDPLVILYSLYKFSEACGGYCQFSLSRLLDVEVESAGVSPAEIFGLERGQLEKLLNGLAINYPEFLKASFTLDLEHVTLNPETTSQDVLNLFS